MNDNIIISTDEAMNIINKGGEISVTAQYEDSRVLDIAKKMQSNRLERIRLETELSIIHTENDKNKYTRLKHFVSVYYKKKNK